MNCFWKIRSVSLGKLQRRMKVNVARRTEPDGGDRHDIFINCWKADGRQRRRDTPISPIGIVLTFIAVAETKRICRLFRRRSLHAAHLTSEPEIVGNPLD